MTGQITSNIEKELNEIVEEYLQYCNYTSTGHEFINETRAKGKPVPKELQSFKSSEEIFHKFFDALHRGDKLEYFELWNSKLPEKLREDDSVCQKLEFYCQIYFAIFPITHNIEDKETESLSMQGFRDYLESRGAKLSKSTEFVRFYALPYVFNPRDHPSFVELFQDTWVLGLEMRLQRFFQLVLGNQGEPRILKLYKQNNVDDDGLSLKQLQSQVVESEKRTSQYMKRLNQVQLDYHSLIGISAELVDLLEGSLQGVPVSPSHLQHVCQKLLVSQQHRLKSHGMPLTTSYDISRPGTASMMLRKSFHIGNENFINGQKETQKSLITSSTVKPITLNFQLIKNDLETGDEKTKNLLLQALRWRLTKADVESRDKFIGSLCQNDIVGIESGSYHDIMFGIITSSTHSEQLQEFFARLINAISTLCRGRSYLAKNTDVCKVLFEKIRGLNDEESHLRENLIGALQKLSLRRPIQSYLIKNGMLEWLMSLLEGSSTISDYTLDYSVALLMNLCLRTIGKKECVQHKTRILNVLTKMLNTFNREITSYVNGALYSILVMPEIREEARVLNMEATLKTYMTSDHPDLNRQLEYIINQLKSNDTPKVEDSDDEDEDDDEEDPAVMEVELDKDEPSLVSGYELSGEGFLNNKYNFKSNSRKSSKLGDFNNPTINRPVTPATYSVRKVSSTEVQPNDRPATRSGSRPSSSQENKISEAKSKPDGNTDYKKGFIPRATIPRTPDNENIKRSSLSGPLPSSGRLPTPSSSSNSLKGKNVLSTMSIK